MTDNIRYRAIDSFDLQAVDANGDPTELTWDEETLVTIDNQPWEDAFGTDTFHKAEYVVTKPAEQPYYVDGEQKTFTKPRDALKEAQWRLDNLPWTIEHPPSKRVEATDEARGFWRGPYYVEEADEQRAALYVPANDDEALEYAVEHEGVSVGFTHTLTDVDEYDGTIGGDVSVDNVDALQTDILYDHVATVETPRLPDSGRVAGDALPTNDDGDTLDMSSLATAGGQPAGIATVDSTHMSGRGSSHMDELADISLSPQVSDGSTVTVDYAVATRPFYVTVHTRGDEIQYVSPSLSPSRGTSGPHDENMVLRDHDIELDQPLTDDTEVFVALNYTTVRNEKGGFLLGPRGFHTERTDVVVNESLDAASTTRSKARATPSDYVFETRDAAIDAAQDLGCDGAHQRDDGMWMPCESRDSLQSTLEAHNQSVREEMDSISVDDAPQGIHVEDDTWYAIAPSETSDDEPKYPLTSCTGEDSIDSAWQLRGHGHYDIDQSTLEERIRRAASAMSCDLDLGNTETDSISIPMTDDNGLSLDDMSVDAIAEQHDGVAEVIEQKAKYERQADELDEQKSAVEEELENVREELDSYKAKEREKEVNERIDTLTDLTDRWAEDDLREMDVDSHEEHIQRLDERIEIYEDITEPSTPVADEGDGGEDGGDSEYSTGDVLDLSDTA